MRIKLIVVGKTRERFLQIGEDEFKNRLQRFCQLDWTVVKEEKITSNRSEAAILEREAERMFAKIPRAAYTIALDRTGKQLSSQELADFLQQKMNQGIGEMCFIIGGPLGLDRKILTSSDLVLSLSPMTFTHEMTRLILLEQLYRAFTILKGTGYHK